MPSTYEVKVKDEDTQEDKTQVTLPSQNGDQNQSSQATKSVPTQENKQTQSPSLDQNTADKLRQEISQDVTKSVSDTVSKSIIERIGSALGLNKQEQEEEIPKDPEALKKFVNDQVQARLKDQKDQEQSQVQQTQEQRQQQIDTIITGWHSQYEALARMGKLPKIEDSSNKDDKGVVARRKLILEVGKIIDENKQNGIQYTPTIQDALMVNPQVVNGVPGANLPISGNTSSANSGEAFSNKEIRGKSFLEIAAESAK